MSADRPGPALEDVSETGVASHIYAASTAPEEPAG
jgi:hypothetical protein